MKSKIFTLSLIVCSLVSSSVFAYQSSSIGGDSSTSGGSTGSGSSGTNSSGSIGGDSASSTKSDGVSNSTSTYQNGSANSSNDSSQYSSNSIMSAADGVNDQINSNYVPEECGTYIKEYIKIGGNNNVQDVKNLQTFLNTTQGEKLAIDGVYKDVDIAAVKRFQTKYIDVLKFWGLTEATGQVLQTTINKINTLHCEKDQNFKCPYFGAYQKIGTKTNEVIKIKKFLNNTQGENLNISSNVFDDAMFVAVKRFQSKYLHTALKPWGITEATGFWYQSTRKTAHDIVGCFEAVRLDNGVVLR